MQSEVSDRLFIGRSRAAGVVVEGLILSAWRPGPEHQTGKRSVSLLEEKDPKQWPS